MSANASYVVVFSFLSHTYAAASYDNLLPFTPYQALKKSNQKASGEGSEGQATKPGQPQKNAPALHQGSGGELEQLKQEIAIMKKLRHPNVLRLYEVIDDVSASELYLVLEVWL
jgi:serine/threonine protein kinase